MLALAAPLLSAILLAQPVPDAKVTGTVVDEQAKPVAGVQVVMYAPPIGNFKGDPVEANTETDAAGRFDFTAPPLGRIYTNGVHVCAFKAGFAIAAIEYHRTKTHQIVLRKPETRRVRVEAPEGKPIAGTRIEARLIFFAGGTGTADIPASLASPLATTTAADGTATLTFLCDRDRLVAARLRADTIGEQDLPVAEETAAGKAPSSFAIKLKKTGRLAGRVVDQAGRGVAGQAVEIWTRGASGGLTPNPIRFKNGPPRTDSDGAFQTPANLLIGSSYRVVVREPGNEPIISDFFPITEDSVAIPPLELRPLRSVSGQVVDRQGKPVPDVEVFQSGDGPRRTSVRTDGSGRFALGGFPIGTAYLFARGEGFRFHGKLLKPGEKEVSIELTRSSERPALELTKLHDPVPIEESRALARRILERWWNAAVEKRDEGSKFFVIQFLLPADPPPAYAEDECRQVRFGAGAGASSEPRGPRGGPHRLRGRRNPGQVDHRPGHPRRHARTSCRLAPCQ